MSNASAFETANPAKHWQQPYVPEVDKKAMAAAGVGTRRQFHQLAEGDEEAPVTSKRRMRLGFEKTGAVILDVLHLGQDLCQKPTLWKFLHLHIFMVSF